MSACADGSRRAVHPIDGAIRQADVVEDVVQLFRRNYPPNRGLDEVHQPGGFFDACAGFGADVEEYLAAVRARDEVLSQPGHQEKGGETTQEKPRDEEGPPLDQRREQPLVGQAQAFKAVLERLLEADERVARAYDTVLLPFEQVHGHRRHQRPRQEVGGQHGEDDRLGQRHKEVAGHTP